MSTTTDAELGISGRIARYFLASPLTALIALLAIMLGLAAIVMTAREEEPQIDVTMANVLVPFPGAGVSDVERLIAGPGEQVLSQMAGLEHVYSLSRPGMALFTVQFNVGVPRQTALVTLHDTVRSQFDTLYAGLGVGTPMIKAKGIDDVPIVTLTLWTRDQARAAYDLERIAHSLESELKRVPGTREVQTLGGPGREVRVELSPEKLQAVGVSALAVQQALQSANAAVIAGETVSNNRTVLVQAGDMLRSRHDIAALVVAVHEGRPVYLSDVASIRDVAAQPSRYVWLGLGPAAQKTITSADAGAASVLQEFPAVTLTITKKPGENAIDVANAVLQRVEVLRNTVLPHGVAISVTRNYGETAAEKARKLMQKLLFATLSVVALVMLALGRREAIIVGVAVLLTLAVTLFSSWAWGFTLNRVSLFALIFSIGILVDDAIVVVENIHRHRLLRPEASLRELIPLAVDEVGGPTILATFTVMAALLPMAFVSGLMGPYMSPIPINASMGMLLSLAIAFVVTPWLGHKLLGQKRLNGHEHGANQHKAHVPGIYLKTLEQCSLNRLAHVLRFFVDETQGKRRRHRLYAGLMALIVLAMSLGVFKLVILKMLPFDNKSEFQVVLNMPEGTALETTAAVLHRMGERLSSVPELRDYQAYAGTSAPINFNGLVRQYDLRSASSQGDIQVNLQDKHHRSRSSHAIADAVRADLEKIAAESGGRVQVVEVPPGPPVQAPLVAEIYGPSAEGRSRLAAELSRIFASTAHVTAIDNSTTAVAPRDVIQIDHNKAMAMGVSTDDITRTIALGVAGSVATVMRAQDDKYGVPVLLTLPAPRQATLAAVLRLSVPVSGAPVAHAAGVAVPLSELVQVQHQQREQVAYHKDLLPVSYVTGDVDAALDSPLYALFAMREAIAALSLPGMGPVQEFFVQQPEDSYRHYAIKWDGEWQITYETFRDMGMAYAVGLVLIYLLVVAQFRSYSLPLVIMAPIPLTVIGVMPGHALLGANFTATSMIGMIALAGIIVRNSILLVDFVQLQRRQGVTLADAVVQAAVARARPILLTGLAAMIGAFFILDDPIFNGLAIALIFGILVSTLLTLVLVPVATYALLSQTKEASA